MKNLLEKGELYAGENGRLFCSEHAGHCAKTTGKDLDGAPVHKVSKAEKEYWFQQFGTQASCEDCVTEISMEVK